MPCPCFPNITPTRSWKPDSPNEPIWGIGIGRLVGTISETSKRCVYSASAARPAVCDKGSAMGNAVDHGADQPYFFLSYAHTPRHDQGEQTDPDYWVEELFRDLSRHMRGMLGLSSDADPGFMDRELRPGNEWPEALARALATCRVFIPLYSRRYFASVHCGKEWSAFARRIARYQEGGSGEQARFIVPALWVPVRGSLPPEVARYEAADFGDIYADLGFYGIMKLTRYHDEYETAVSRLAKQIVEAGKETSERKPLPPGPMEKYEQLQNAFGAAHQTGDGERRVLVTVVALDASSQALGGSGAQYGETAQQWTPYPEESSRPLAEEAADLATSLGYLPEVGGSRSTSMSWSARPRRPAPWCLSSIHGRRGCRSCWTSSGG